MTDVFSQPDDFGELKSSELHSSVGESLGATAGESFMSGVRGLGRQFQYASAEGIAAMTSDAATLNPATQEWLEKQRAAIPEVPMADAQAHVKQEGLEGHFKLPDQPTIKKPVLDLMVQHAHERQQYDAAVSRGPQNFGMSALSFVTEMGVGIIDPVNIAAFSIPVVGEARYGMMMKSAGESILKRTGVKAGVGATQGAVGGAALVPGDWWLHTQDGVDYTMADALHSVVMSAGMGGAFHALPGLYGDVRARIAGQPLHPAEVLADLPPRAQEDVVRAATADVINGNAVRVGEMLIEAAKEDPRIAESLRGVSSRTETTINGQTSVETRAPEVGKIDATHDIVSGANSGHEAVFAEAHGALTKAGVPDADVHASVVAARYTTRAARLGKSALDMYRGEGLEVRRGEAGPAVGRSFDQGGRPESIGAIADGTAYRLPIHNETGADVGSVKFDLRDNPPEQGIVKVFGAGVEGEAQGKGHAIAAYQKLADYALSTGRVLWSDTSVSPSAARIYDALERRGYTVERTRAEQVISHDDPAFKVTAGPNRSFNQSMPAFFSAVSRVVDDVKQEKAPAAQWLGMLKNKPGVKPEEMEWLGLENWLKDQKGTVTKAQIQDYIRANNIEVKEVMKGAPSPLAAFEQRMQEKHGDLWMTGLSDAEKAERATLANAPDREQQTKFNRPDLVLPGGENYRELLLTLPSKKPDVLPADWTFKREPDGGVYVYNSEGEMVAGGATRAEAESNAMFQISEGARRTEGKTTSEFRSQHWDEPNVLAHIRFNDREIDGKRTLFIEEVQSDWHQKGKKEGYQGRGAEMSAAEVADVQRRLNTDGLPYSEAVRAGRVTEEEMRRYHAYLDRDQGVPDAPFKTTWPELSLKRMIRYASENGYDQVAWTPGKVQAARYDLSKQVSHIDHWKNADGSYHVAAYKGREQVWHEASATPKIIEDTLGKDITEKIINREGESVDHSYYEKPDPRRLSGLDLKVGGEGMKGFYDEILPATANKLTKKYGARVGKAEIRASELDDRVAQINRDTQEAAGAGDNDRQWDLVAERLRLENEAGRELGTHPGATRVHTLPLTPELKRAAMGGFPLFQRGNDAIANAKGRITLGSNKAIIDMFAGADHSTMMHEMGHLWLDELTRDAETKGVPQALKDDLGTVLRWLGVTKSEDIGVAQHEQWARGFEQYLMEGKAPSNALTRAFAQFKDWLTQIYRSLKNLGVPITDDIRGVMDRMLATDEQIAQRREKADWQKVADAKRGPDDDLTGASIAAEKAKEPESIDTTKSLTAAEKAAAETDQLLKDILPTLSEAERKQFEDALSAMDQEKADNEKIVKEGFACLMGAIA